MTNIIKVTIEPVHIHIHSYQIQRDYCAVWQRTILLAKNKTIMSNKTLSILSYITIIGWLIAYFKSRDLDPKSNLVNYHLRQGFGFFIFSFVLNIALTIVTSIVPALFFLNYLTLILLILWVFGIINAVNDQEKPIPVIGKLFEDKFSFIG